MDFEKYEIAGRTTLLPVPRSYRDCVELIKSDSFRHNGRRDSLFHIWLSSFTRTSMGFSIWFRLCSYRGWAYPFTRFMLNRYKRRYGMFVPARTRIGYGLHIQHCFGIVINPSAVIGNNFHINQFSTIGAGDGRAATIGDNVYVGPGVNIVDDVVIGSGAVVGAGATVTKDVAPDTVVGGVPAKPLATVPNEKLNPHLWPFPKQ